MQYGIDDRFISRNHSLHGVWIHIHQKVEDIQRQPRHKENDGDAQNHDVGAPPFLIIFSMLTLKIDFFLDTQKMITIEFSVSNDKIGKMKHS